MRLKYTYSIVNTITTSVLNSLYHFHAVVANEFPTNVLKSSQRVSNTPYQAEDKKTPTPLSSFSTSTSRRAVFLGTIPSLNKQSRLQKTGGLSRLLVLPQSIRPSALEGLLGSIVRVSDQSVPLAQRLPPPTFDARLHSFGLCR